MDKIALVHFMFMIKLKYPNARSRSKKRLLNYINIYADNDISEVCEFNGLDIYIGNELFATSGYDIEEVPFFTFFSKDSELYEKEFYKSQQKNMRSKILEVEREWIYQNMSKKANEQIQEAIQIINKNDFGAIHHFDNGYPQESIKEGYIQKSNSSYRGTKHSNVINLFPANFYVTGETYSFLEWRKNKYAF